MARASIHQLITMLADESQSVDVDFPQVREWLQELIQLRDQMSKIKAQYPSLAPQEQPYGVFEDYEKHNVEQPFIQQMEAEALEAANKNMLERIEGLQRVLQSRDDKISELSSQVAELEKTLEARVSAWKDTAAARERRVADLEKHNRNLATEIKSLTEGNLALDAARVERHNKVCELEARVSALSNTEWAKERNRLVNENYDLQQILIDRDAQIKSLCDKVSDSGMQLAGLINDKMMLQHVLEDREAQIKTLTDQKQELQDELTFRRDITLGATVSDYDALKAETEKLRSELSQTSKLAREMAMQRDNLNLMLQTADADRRALSEEIERLGRVCEVATTRTSRLTPLGQVFKEQAPFELTDSQVIMLVWLLEHTPNARQRTAYVCEGCGQPMVNRDGGQMANPCQCEPGVGRKTVGIF